MLCVVRKGGKIGVFRKKMIFFPFFRCKGFDF